MDPALPYRRSGVVFLSLLFILNNGILCYSAESNFWSERRQAARHRSSSFLAALPASSALGGPGSLVAQFPSPKAPNLTLSDSLSRSIPKEFRRDHAALFSALSPAFGTVRKVAGLNGANANGPVVVHIQDVHMNAEAQWNIRETVGSLLKIPGVDVLALEGSTEEIPLQRFVDVPQRKAVRWAADYLLKENKISGPIHAALTAEGRLPRILGVDDTIHYEANVKAYRDSAPRLAEIRAALRNRSARIEAQKAAVYSPALQVFDRQVNAYRAQSITLGAYVLVLRGENQARVLNPGEKKREPVIERFVHALEAERRLDFGRVETERARLIETLSGRLSVDESNALMADSVAYRSGALRYADFYARLQSLCERKKIRLSDYPTMDAYVRYVLLADGINAEDLLAALTRLEKENYARLAVGVRERALMEESRRTWLTVKLVDFALTPSEWAEYESYSKAGETLDLASFESFYREAHARDGAMAENILAALETKEPAASSARANRTAVLVTGGYHAEGIARALIRRGVTVVSYTPKIEKVDTAQGSAYLSVFSQEKTPLEKLFEGEKLFLSQPPAPREITRVLLPTLICLVFLLLALAGPADVTHLYKTLDGAGTLQNVLSGPAFAQGTVLLAMGALSVKLKGGPSGITEAEIHSAENKKGVLQNVIKGGAGAVGSLADAWAKVRWSKSIQDYRRFTLRWAPLLELMYAYGGLNLAAQGGLIDRFMGRFFGYSGPSLVRPVPFQGTVTAAGMGLLFAGLWAGPGGLFIAGALAWAAASAYVFSGAHAEKSAKERTVLFGVGFLLAWASLGPVLAFLAFGPAGMSALASVAFFGVSLLGGAALNYSLHSGYNALALRYGWTPATIVPQPRPPLDPAHHLGPKARMAELAKFHRQLVMAHKQNKMADPPTLKKILAAAKTLSPTLQKIYPEDELPVRDGNVDLFLRRVNRYIFIPFGWADGYYSQENFHPEIDSSRWRRLDYLNAPIYIGQMKPQLGGRLYFSPVRNVPSGFVIIDPLSTARLAMAAWGSFMNPQNRTGNREMWEAWKSLLLEVQITDTQLAEGVVEHLIRRQVTEEKHRIYTAVVRGVGLDYVTLDDELTALAKTPDALLAKIQTNPFKAFESLSPAAKARYHKLSALKTLALVESLLEMMAYDKETRSPEFARALFVQMFIKAIPALRDPDVFKVEESVPWFYIVDNLAGEINFSIPVSLTSDAIKNSRIDAFFRELLLGRWTDPAALEAALKKLHSDLMRTQEERFEILQGRLPAPEERGDLYSLYPHAPPMGQVAEAVRPGGAIVKPPRPRRLGTLMGFLLARVAQEPTTKPEDEETRYVAAVVDFSNRLARDVEQGDFQLSEFLQQLQLLRATSDRLNSFPQVAEWADLLEMDWAQALETIFLSRLESAHDRVVRGEVNGLRDLMALQNDDGLMSLLPADWKFHLEETLASDRVLLVNARRIPAGELVSLAPLLGLADTDADLLRSLSAGTSEEPIDSVQAQRLVEKLGQSTPSEVKKAAKPQPVPQRALGEENTLVVQGFVVTLSPTVKPNQWKQWDGETVAALETFLENYRTLGPLHPAVDDGRLTRDANNIYHLRLPQGFRVFFRVFPQPFPSQGNRPVLAIVDFESAVHETGGGRRMDPHYVESALGPANRAAGYDDPLFSRYSRLTKTPRGNYEPVKSNDDIPGSLSSTPSTLSRIWRWFGLGVGDLDRILRLAPFERIPLLLGMGIAMGAHLMLESSLLWVAGAAALSAALGSAHKWGTYAFVNGGLREVTGVPSGRTAVLWFNRTVIEGLFLWGLGQVLPKELLGAALPIVTLVWLILDFKEHQIENRNWVADHLPGLTPEQRPIAREILATLAQRPVSLGVEEIRALVLKTAEQKARGRSGFAINGRGADARLGRGPKVIFIQPGALSEPARENLLKWVEKDGTLTVIASEPISGVPTDRLILAPEAFASSGDGVSHDVYLAKVRSRLGARSVSGGLTAIQTPGLRLRAEGLAPLDPLADAAKNPVVIVLELMRGFDGTIGRWPETLDVLRAIANMA